MILKLQERLLFLTDPTRTFRINNNKLSLKIIAANTALKTMESHTPHTLTVAEFYKKYLQK